MAHIDTHSIYKQYAGLLSPMVDGMRIHRVASYLKPNSSVLDIGCGASPLLEKLPNGCTYQGIDLDPATIEENKKRFPIASFFCLDVSQTKFPFPDHQFDFVVAAAFIEHIEDLSFFLSEVARVLKKEGRIIFTTPTKIGGRVHAVMAFMGLLSRHAAEEHKDFFDLKTMEKALPSSGLVVEKHIPFQCGMNQVFLLQHRKN